MRCLFVLLLTALLSAALVFPAYADVIAPTPLEIAGETGVLPLLLVVLAAAVTIALLRKKKRK